MNGFFITLYPGTELNRHSHYCEQDFKSCVSTNSTTRVSKKNPDEVGINLRAEDRARTGHLDLGKVALYQMSYFRIFLKNCSVFSDCKNKACCKNNKTYFTYILDCTKYCRAQLRLACLCIGVHINHNKYRK